MWRSRRSETDGNRRLWDEGGMRDVERSRKNVLVRVYSVLVEG